MQKIDFKHLDHKTRIEIAVTSALVVALVIILSSSMKAASRVKKPFQSVPIQAVAFREIAKRDLSITTRSEQIEKAYREAEAKRLEEAAPWGRDPFAARSSFEEGDWGISDLRLEGVVWDETAPHAVINGQVVEKGDQIGRNTVLYIEKDAVVISDGAKRYRLSF